MVPVVSYMDIEKRMEEGTTNRTVAATNMNATSRSVSMSMISSLTGVVGSLVGWFIGCSTSRQHASVSQGRICSDKFACRHTEIGYADQIFCLTQ